MGYLLEGGVFGFLSVLFRFLPPIVCIQVLITSKCIEENRLIPRKIESLTLFQVGDHHHQELGRG